MTIVISHELGHAVEYALSQKLAQAVNESAGGFTVGYDRYYGAISEHIMKVVASRVAKKDADFSVQKWADYVSGYGAWYLEEKKSCKELFAEAFSEYLSSPTPRVVASTLGEVLDEWMSGNLNGFQVEK